MRTLTRKLIILHDILAFNHTLYNQLSFLQISFIALFFLRITLASNQQVTSKLDLCPKWDIPHKKNHLYNSPLNALAKIDFFNKFAKIGMERNLKLNNLNINCYRNENHLPSA